jgi:multidrug efflux pump subunit AcrA (membrane-fusion protein)
MPIRRFLVFYALLVVAVPLGYFFVQANPEVAAAGGGPAGGGGGGNASTSLQYFVVEQGEVVQFVSAVGEIEADKVVNMSFTTPGRVRDVFVNPSDFVEEGDLLMVIENDNQRIGYDQALLNLENNQIALADLLGPPDGDAVRIAEANVEAAFDSYRASNSTASIAEIQAADLQVQQAQAALDSAIERRTLGGDFNNEMEVTLADAQIGEASFNLEIANLRAQDLRTGDWAGANAAYLRYLQAEAELERVLAGPAELDIQQAEVRVEQAEAQLASAELALSKTEIRAPFAGFVADVLVEPGSTG